MQIDKDVVVHFTYKMTNEAQVVLEDTTNDMPMAYLHGHGGLLRGLERAMQGRKAGDEFQITLAPEDAYGIKKDNAEQKIPMKHLQGAKKWKKGMIGVVKTEQGMQRVTVVKPGKFMVTVDFNHPFAGMSLIFNVKITKVRIATPEEIEHGHAHGDGGHQH